jgi:hypothetical protein
MLLIVLLLALRLPSLVQPAGSDQGIYGYDGQRVLAGDVLYRDAWDQKPPGIALVYALLWRVWPHESVVAAADLTAAAAVAGLLIVIGRRRFSEDIGFGAAAVFLLFADPSLQRLGGVFVRSQCETFIALAVAGALAVLSARTRRTWHLWLAGVGLAMAFWLKYNAATYALPVALAAWAWGRDDARGRPGLVVEWLWITAGFAVVTTGVLAYFAMHGGFHDLWLATVDYNFRYSEETYANQSRLAYLIAFPVARARVEMIWFLGGLGALALSWQARANRSAAVALGWLAAAILSIVVNGARDLPQYFVQAWPALALAAGAGLGSVFGRGLSAHSPIHPITHSPTYPGWVRYAAAVTCLAGLWRVGVEPAGAGLRFGGLPSAIDHFRWDLAYARGRVDRATYLAAFRHEQKYDALEIDNLSRYVRATTTQGDAIYVFGFAGGSVCWKSERMSASRFSWSQPVLREFAAGEPGYGSAGMLADLLQRKPILVALQRQEQWKSQEFFMGHAPLRAWLQAGYMLDYETPKFAVWRRKP